MLMTVQNETDLVEKILNGDAEAWNALVTEYHADVYRYILSLTRSVADAEDLTQEAFVRFYRSGKQFKGNCGLRTWLHRLAFNEFRKWNRRRKQPIEPLPPLLPETVDPFVIATLEEVALLPPGQQVAFSLVELQGFTVEECAQILRIPAGTVKSRLHHARKALRQSLTEQKEETYGQQPVEI